MHYRMLIPLDSPADADSADVRREVFDRMMADDSFCGDGGRFGSPLCDWFVIGGRWSGLLKETLLGDGYKAAFEREFPEMATGWYSSDLVDTHRDHLDQLLQRFGGTGPSPLTR